jgi:hypothetical protein
VGKRKQRMCRMCKKRPPWKHKNCPPGVCKQCYHKKVWIDRPAARKERAAATGQKAFDDPGFDVQALIMRELLGNGWEDAPDPPWFNEPEPPWPDAADPPWPEDPGWGENHCPF